MSIKVLIPTPLRSYAGKQSTIEVSGQTVGEALKNDKRCGDRQLHSNAKVKI